jgi:hypothetical protein
MSSKEVWIRAPASVRGMTAVDTKTDLSSTKSGTTRTDTSSTYNQNRGRRGISSSRQKQLPGSTATTSAPGDDLDDQTAFTQSATQSVATPSMLSSATSRRLNELEALFRRQQQDTSENAALSTQNANSLIHIEAKLGRLDDMDNLLHDNREKLAITMERQQDSHVQIVELNIRVSKLMDVIDRMATKIESMTTTMLTGNRLDSEKRNTENQTDSTRRRTLEEMNDTQTSFNSSEDGKPSTMSEQDQTMAPDNTMPHQPQHLQTAHLSPSKKKSRSLHDDMEEMSLGSNDSMETPAEMEIPPNQSLHDMSLPDSSLLDESNDFSYQTPDPDTQYNNHGDPEGGAPK